MATAFRGSRLAATVFRAIPPTPMVFKGLPQAWAPAALTAKTSVAAATEWPVGRRVEARLYLAITSARQVMPEISMAICAPPAQCLWAAAQERLKALTNRLLSGASSQPR